MKYLSYVSSQDFDSNKVKKDLFNLKETFNLSIDDFAECIFMDKNYIHLGYKKTRVNTLDISSLFVEQKDEPDYFYMINESSKMQKIYREK